MTQAEIFLTADEAEAAFYSAFERRDLESMMRVWARKGEISCIHPGGSRLDTRAAIKGSWIQIFSSESGLRFTITQARRSNDGELAVHIVKESISIKGVGHGVALATNVYRREENGWHMILHHASPEPAGSEARGDASLH